MFRRILILFFTLLASRAALSANVRVDKTEAKEGAKDSSLVRKNVELSDKIDRLATSLDEYLAGKKLTDEKNTTSLILENRITSAEDQSKPVEYEPLVSLRLHLPNFEEKWSARFSSYDEDQQTTGIQRYRLQTRTPEKNYGASVRFFKQLGKVQIEFRPRVQVDKVSHILSFESNSQYNKWVFTPRLELFGKSDMGTGQFLGLNLSYLLDDHNSLVLVNDEQYVDAGNQFSTNHGFVWNRRMDDLSRTWMSLIFEFESQPHDFRLHQYVLSTGLEHLFLKNVIGLAFNPYIVFQEKPEFEKIHGVLLNIFLIF